MGVGVGLPCCRGCEQPDFKWKRYASEAVAYQHFPWVSIPGGNDGTNVVPRWYIDPRCSFVRLDVGWAYLNQASQSPSPCGLTAPDFESLGGYPKAAAWNLKRYVVPYVSGALTGGAAAFRFQRINLLRDNEIVEIEADRLSLAFGLNAEVPANSIIGMIRISSVKITTPTKVIHRIPNPAFNRLTDGAEKTWIVGPDDTCANKCVFIAGIWTSWAARHFTEAEIAGGMKFDATVGGSINTPNAPFEGCCPSFNGTYRFNWSSGTVIDGKYLMASFAMEPKAVPAVPCGPQFTGSATVGGAYTTMENAAPLVPVTMAGELVECGFGGLGTGFGLGDFASWRVQGASMQLGTGWMSSNTPTAVNGIFNPRTPADTTWNPLTLWGGQRCVGNAGQVVEVPGP